MAVAPTESIFKRIVTGHDVEQVTLKLFKRWFGTYLSEVERQHGITAGTLARPRGWSIAPSFDKWPEDQLPAIVVVSVGLADVPVKDGRGTYRAKWDMVIGAVCSARTQEESRLMSMFYIAALGTLLDQRPSLEAGAVGLDWLDEDYTVLEFDDTRSVSAGAGRFHIQFDNVRSTRAGPLAPDEPLDPDTLPWPDDQAVELVDIDVLNVLVDEDLPQL